MPHLTYFQLFLCLILIFLSIWMISVDIRLRQLLKLIVNERTLQSKLMLDFTALTDAVTATQGIEASAIQIITTLAGEIAVNANDPATISKLADELNQNAKALAAAISAVPAADLPPVTTTPPPTTTLAP